MVDAEVLKSIASELIAASAVTVEGKSAPVRRTSRQRLRTAVFSVDGHQYQAIEQNPDKPSPWGQLARSGHQVAQCKDAERHKFVAVVVDDEMVSNRDVHQQSNKALMKKARSESKGPETFDAPSA